MSKQTCEMITSVDPDTGHEVVCGGVAIASNGYPCCARCVARLVAEDEDLLRDFKPLEAEPPLPEELRDMLSEALGGRPDFEGFLESITDEIAWLKNLATEKEPRDFDIRELQDLASKIKIVGEHQGFL